MNILLVCLIVPAVFGGSELDFDESIFEDPETMFPLPFENPTSPGSTTNMVHITVDQEHLVVQNSSTFKDFQLKGNTTDFQPSELSPVNTTINVAHTTVAQEHSVGQNGSTFKDFQLKGNTTDFQPSELSPVITTINVAHTTAAQEHSVVQNGSTFKDFQLKGNTTDFKPSELSPVNTTVPATTASHHLTEGRPENITNKEILLSELSLNENGISLQAQTSYSTGMWTTNNGSYTSISYDTESATKQPNTTDLVTMKSDTTAISENETSHVVSDITTVNAFINQTLSFSRDDTSEFGSDLPPSPDLQEISTSTSPSSVKTTSTSFLLSESTIENENETRKDDKTWAEDVEATQSFTFEAKENSFVMGNTSEVNATFRNIVSIPQERSGSIDSISNIDLQLKLATETMDDFKHEFVKVLLRTNWSYAEKEYFPDRYQEKFLVFLPKEESYEIQDLKTELSKSYSMMQHCAVALEHLTLDLVLSSKPEFFPYVTRVSELSKQIELLMDYLRASILECLLLPRYDQNIMIAYTAPESTLKQRERDFAILQNTRMALSFLGHVFDKIRYK